MRYIILLCCVFPQALLAQNPLDKIIRNDPWLLEVVSQPDYQVQIIYTQIDRTDANRPAFESYKFGVDADHYFYPASTVKLPAAVLALEKLNKLSIIGLDRNARLEIQTSRSPQKAVTVDSTSADLKPSIAQYIKKIFLVSDNDAYNRLYEFLGQEYFNTTLRKKGYKNTRILHRLGPEGAPFKFDDNQYTNAFSFYNDDKLIYHQGEVFSKTNDPLELLWGQMKGTAHVNKEEVLVQQPFNFKQKNYFSLQDLHDVLKAVIFPRNTPSIRRFQLKPDDYSFLYQYMSQVPRKSDIPAYADKADNYVKFFWNGDKPGQIPDNIKIFNKVGWAYGFLTDVSYIIDTENNIEYMLAATIHVNKNETYNDGEYEYETVGLPFFSKLGQAIYERELKRRRKRKPDFAWLLD